MKKNLKFEEGLNRLNEIIALLESGEKGLEESVKLYGEAMELSTFCEKKLTEAKLLLETAAPEAEK